MASSDLNDLIPNLKEKALKVQALCKEKGGFGLLICSTVRTLEEQAKLFRQSRSTVEIKAKIQTLRAQGFGFLADIIKAVGPCSGPDVTNAGPGESWHNYGQAWDAVPTINGKPAWDYQAAKPQWDFYGKAVRQVGMYWGGDWNKFRDYPHAQAAPDANPLMMKAPDLIKLLLSDKLKA